MICQWTEFSQGSSFVLMNATVPFRSPDIVAKHEINFFNMKPKNEATSKDDNK